MAKGKAKQQKSSGKRQKRVQLDPAAEIAPKRQKLKRGQPRPAIPLPVSTEDTPVSDEDADGIEAEQATAFLEGLDVNRIGQARSTLRDEYRKNRPAAAKKAAAFPRTSVIAESSKGKGRAQADEDDTVAIAELDEDDLAFGSGASDDDLSVISGFDANAEISDDLLSDGDSDLNDLDSADLEAELDEESASDADEWGGIDGSPQRMEAPVLDPEDAYASRKRRRLNDPDENALKAPRKLPIKLPDGTLAPHPADVAADEQAESRQPVSRVTFDELEDSSGEDEEDEISEAEQKKRAAGPKSDPLGRRFGRPAVRQILELKDPVQRLTQVREEIASLGRDITSDPENSLNLLRRLLTFALTTLPASTNAPAIPIDAQTRALALLSLLTVFTDIVPDYRIRALTDGERDTKVSQIVLRQREWEDGLLTTYRKFLETCEKELQDGTVLAPAALRCLCNLLKTKTQFNFTVNIMDALAQQLGRTTWDETSRQCLDAVITVFSNDKTGSDSLHLVRQLAKSIKARSFKVNPALLSSFLHLRLRDELGSVRASAAGVERERVPQIHLHKNKDGGKRKAVPEARLSKKAKRMEKSKRDIAKELAEAELEIVDEDKQRDQTETLKLLFSLYFGVIKLESRSPLLPACLEGLARFAHLISVDFFKDLLTNLRRIMGDEHQRSLRERLLCVVTAFALLSGQGEALNLDLVDFINELYGALLELAATPAIEDRPTEVATDHRNALQLSSPADLAFRALAFLFISSRASSNPPTRTLAFAKRLLSCTLSFPTETALRTLELVQKMIGKEPQLEFMLSTDDNSGAGDGQYRAEADDPALSNPHATVWWELATLRTHHYDERIREEAQTLSDWVKNG